MNDAAQVHDFEKRGLGVAPFRVVGFESTADRRAMNRFREAHGMTYTTNLCGGTCARCGMAIFNVFIVEDANGKQFKVGSECVTKTGDAGMIRRVKDAMRAADRVKRDARRHAKETADREYLESMRRDRAADLAATAHPNHFRANAGETLLDYVTWILDTHRGGWTAAAAVVRSTGMFQGTGREVATA